MDSYVNGFNNFKTALKRTAPEYFYAEGNGSLFCGDSLHI